MQNSQKNKDMSKNHRLKGQSNDNAVFHLPKCSN